MWRCKVCDGVVRVEVTCKKEFNISKEGEPTGKCLKTRKQEQSGISLFCTRCGRVSNSLKFMADWVEEK